MSDTQVKTQLGNTEYITEADLQYRKAILQIERGEITLDAALSLGMFSAPSDEELARYDSRRKYENTNVPLSVLKFENVNQSSMDNAFF
jgi:hypothetical protein